MVPSKALSDQVWIISHVFVYLNCFPLFLVSLQSNLCISCLQKSMEKCTEINTFRISKTTFSSTFSLYIGHRYLCIEGQFKFRFQSLYHLNVYLRGEWFVMIEFVRITDSCVIHLQQIHLIEGYFYIFQNKQHSPNLQN